MTADKIREKFQRTDSGDYEVVQITVLAEIAAQLSELNMNIRISNSLKSGGGYPEA